MKTIALTLALVAVVLPAYAAGNNNAPSSAFTLPALPYDTGALAPAIDKKTMEIHHGRHHQTYINNLNAEVEKDAGLKGKTIGDIVTSVSQHTQAVRNNAGGHWNHSFFWTVMAPPAKTGTPSLDFNKAINDAFGSMTVFKEKFEKAGAGQFGSGWVWLIVNKDGKLEIVTTANQDNPLMDDAAVKGTPILGNDVWEHAYYLSYQNKRASYLKNWWTVVNWTKVSENYAEALK